MGDYCLYALVRHCSGFNPRARMGRDILSVTVKVSTVCFNPRARMGRDL